MSKLTDEIKKWQDFLESKGQLDKRFTVSELDSFMPAGVSHKANNSREVKEESGSKPYDYEQSVAENDGHPANLGLSYGMGRVKLAKALKKKGIDPLDDWHGD